MIKAEITSNKATIRIHDGFYEPMPTNHMARLNQIVSGSYKRRFMVKEAKHNEA